MTPDPLVESVARAILENVQAKPDMVSNDGFLLYTAAGPVDCLSAAVAAIAAYRKMTTEVKMLMTWTVQKPAIHTYQKIVTISSDEPLDLDKFGWVLLKEPPSPPAQEKP